MFRRALLHTSFPRSTAVGARSIYNATAAHHRSLLRTRPSCTRARPDEAEPVQRDRTNAEAADATETERAIVNIVKATGWSFLSVFFISVFSCHIGITAKILGY